MGPVIKKKSKTKKFFKYTLISLLSLIVLCFAIIAFVLNVVFSPAKLTPIVLNETEKFIDGELKCEKIELTFFSTFPNFSIEIKNGALIPSDSILNEIKCDKDTLLSFSTISVQVNPIAFLISNKIDIKKVEISDADIYTFVSDNGKANWDMFIIPESEIKEDSVSTDSTEFDSQISLGKIEINRANMTFDDRQAKVFTDMRNFNTSLEGNFSKTVCDLDLKLKAGNLIFWQDGNLLVRKLAFGADTKLKINIPEYSAEIEKSVLEFNGMKVGAAGTIAGDTLNKALDIDIRFGMEVPSLKTLIDLVPVSVVKEAADAKAEGYFILTGSVKGLYGKDIMPVTELSAKIENGKISYAGMPYSVDKLNLSASGKIDFEDKSSSYLEIEEFLFEGASSRIQASANIKNILVNPVVNSKIDANVNFTDLAKTFPLEEGVVMGGDINSAISAAFKLSDVENKDYGKININGFFNAQNVKLESPKDSFYLAVDVAGFRFGANEKDKSQLQNRTLLNAIIGFDGLRLNSRFGNVEADSAAVTFKTSPLIDTTSIASINTTFEMARLNLMLKDSVYLRSGKTEIKAELGPDSQDKKIPNIKSNLVFSSLVAGTKESIAYLKNAGFNLSSTQSATNKKHWISDGIIGFETLKLYTPEFPLLISMPASKLTLNNDRIILHNAGVNIGDSDVRLQGSLSNLYAVIFEQGILYGNLHVSSNFIDCNQIMKALELEAGSEIITAENIETAQTNAPTDSVSEIGVFIVPDKIDFNLTTDIKKVRFGKMDIDNIHGELFIKNQAVELRDLSMHTLAADMSTSLVYKAADEKGASTGFDLDMKDIRVGKLVELMPALDTLVPMLGSLDGTVNFRIAAKAQFDEKMDIVIPTLQAATTITGDSLVLMDGETFSEISKMLRFKNKERNIVDSVSVDVVIHDGMVEIYPFLIGMDRYLAAVGGKHNMDMTFNYHVSLLESPLPFKAGVDIKGNLDKFKFRITKAKYKNIHKSASVSPVDSTSVQVHNFIKNIISK